MADTLTFENTQEVTSVENLSEEEQDSLRVGEALQEQQNELLAGKYKDAQELEKAYVELEKKLGSPKEEAAKAESETEPEAKQEEDKPAQTNILETLWQEATTGDKYSDETLNTLKDMSPGDLASMHLDYRKQVETAGPQNRTLTQQDVTELKGVAGGEQEYDNMLKWAQSNLNEQEIKMFDTVMERGDPLAAFFAVRSLAYRYQDVQGVDGDTITGKPPKSSGDAFRSQQELVKAMADSRYDDDPAYRQDVMDKLARSNVSF